MSQDKNSFLNGVRSLVLSTRSQSWWRCESVTSDRAVLPPMHWDDCSPIQKLSLQALQLIPVPGSSSVDPISKKYFFQRPNPDIDVHRSMLTSLCSSMRTGRKSIKPNCSTYYCFSAFCGCNFLAGVFISKKSHPLWQFERLVTCAGGSATDTEKRMWGLWLSN